VLRNVLARDSENFEANYALGTLYRTAGRKDLAIPLLRKAVRIRPDHFEAALNLGIIERDQGMLVDAHTHLKKAAVLEPDNAIVHATLGALHMDRDDMDAATTEFHRALDLGPDNVEVNTQTGSLYAIRGQPDEAISYYRKAISLSPYYGDAHYRLAFLQRITEYTDDVARMEQAFHDEDIAEQDRILVGTALGKIFDDLMQYDKAFEYMHEANQLQRKSIVYSTDDQRKIIERHMQALDQKLVDHCKTCRITDDTPILILGMPRSGTSLVEQILASHPSVHGAGEVEYARLFAEQARKLTGKPFPQDIDTIAPRKLREFGLAYIENLKTNAGSAQRVTDKLPHNFLRVGLFAALMPDAKIVHCHRDPLDNCLSIYQHRFSVPHGYACDLIELGEYYKLYKEMMSFWQEQLPGHMYHMSYENLVENTESQVRDLLDYCGLAFHEDCLAFDKSTRAVSTPSAPQVRQPIYRDSVGRALNYEQYLQPLIDTLV
jgi:Tfp pilus assembly protein PilF